MRVAVLILSLLLIGCSGSSVPEPEPKPKPPSPQLPKEPKVKNHCRDITAPATEKRKAKRPEALLDPAATHQLTFVTNCGNFTVELEAKASPKIAASFYYLAESGFYDQTLFYRIVPNFVIQGGDPTATGTGNPGYKTRSRPQEGSRYPEGTVAAAKAYNEPPGTFGSQFFVTTHDNHTLPPEYGVLGRVVRGMETVKAIGELGENERPTRTVVIIRVRAVSR